MKSLLEHNGIRDMHEKKDPREKLATPHWAGGLRKRGIPLIEILREKKEEEKAIEEANNKELPR